MEYQDSDEPDFETLKRREKSVDDALRSAGIPMIGTGEIISGRFSLWQQSRPPHFGEHASEFIEFLRSHFQNVAKPMPFQGVRGKLWHILSSPLELVDIPRRWINKYPVSPNYINPDDINFEELYNEFLIENEKNVPLRKPFPPRFSEIGTTLKVVDNQGIPHIPNGCTVQLARPFNYGENLRLIVGNSIVFVLGVIIGFEQLSMNDIQVTMTERHLGDGVVVGGKLKKYVFRISNDNNDPFVDRTDPSHGKSFPVPSPVTAA